MKTYRAKIGKHFHLLIFIFIALPITLFSIDPSAFVNKYYMLLPCAFPAGIAFWSYFTTSYWIDQDKLHYRSGPLKGFFNVGDIKQITSGVTMWVGVKPALATSGLIIKYGVGQLIYLAPMDNQEMIDDLLCLKSDIKVISKKH